jgi:Tol biopolymer transport system component
VLTLNAGDSPKSRLLFDQPDITWIGALDWSNDGASLAVAITRKDNNAQLGVINTTDASLRVLKSSPYDLYPVNMSFSPEGSFVAYDAPASPGFSQPRDVFVRALAGGEETAAVVHAANDRLMGWTADGRSLLFSSDRGGSRGIWSLAMVNGKPQGEPVLVKDIGSVSVDPLGITRSGALFYGARRGAHIEIASVDFATGKMLAAPKSLNANDPFDSRVADWSRDGTWIAYMQEAAGDRRRLVLDSLDTHAKRVFDPALKAWGRPRWTPDDAIIVQGIDESGRQGIFRVNSQTGAVTPIVVPPPGTNAVQSSLSPDGKRLIYRQETGKENVIVERDLSGGAERQLVRRPKLDGLSLSPDGTQLTFIERDPVAQTSVLYVMPIDGGSARELVRMGPGRSQSEQGRLDNFAEWTPDGKRILFAKIQDSVRTWLVPAAGGTPVQIAFDHPFMAARIHPDGRRIAFNVNGPSEVWSLENFQTAGGPGKK